MIWNERNRFIYLIITGIVFLTMLFFAQADIYAGEDDDTDMEIQEEIDEAKSKGKKKVYIKKGTYNENISVKRGIRLIGKDKNGVVISGKITLSDGSKLSKLTVNGGSIVLKNGANAVIENIVIKNARRNAVETTGTGKLILRDSKIYNSGGKGMYIQFGKDVKITGNEIYGNNEEGIDIRANVDGAISGNIIQNNGEGGIEVILGGSELSINGNIIKSNKASGIAAQYYEIARGLGTVKIKNNKITKNKSFGLTCRLPSGGDPLATYWRNSMELQGNTFSENNSGNINKGCHISEVEIVENGALTRKRAIQGGNDSGNETRESEEEKQRKKQETKNSINEMNAEFAASHDKVKEITDKIENEDSVKVFFLGYNQSYVSALKNEKDNISRNIGQLKELMARTKNESNKFLADDLIKKMEQAVSDQDEVINKQEGKFDLSSWLRDIFQPLI